MTSSAGLGMDKDVDGPSHAKQQMLEAYGKGNISGDLWWCRNVTLAFH